MGFHAFIPRHIRPGPCRFDQLLLGAGASSGFQQRLQQSVFLGGQPQVLCVEGGGAAIEAELQRSPAPVFAQRPCGAAQQGLDACLEQCRLEWLHQVVIGALLEPEHVVIQAVASGEHQHQGLIHREVPQFSAHLQPIEAGQVEVEQHQIKAAGLEQGESLKPFAARFRHQAPVLQQFLERVTDDGIVFHDQHFHARGWPVWSLMLTRSCGA